MLIDRAEGVLAAVQMGAIEFHIRGTRADRAEKPDRMVFDLDPDPAVGFAEVREAAAEIRDRLATLGLPSWPMVTGGKGVHVVVPLARVASTETVELFAKLFARDLRRRCRSLHLDAVEKEACRADLRGLAAKPAAGDGRLPLVAARAPRRASGGASGMGRTCCA